MNLTIWTLNRCTDLLEGEDKHIKGIFSPNRVSFGERSNPTQSPRQLMPENEYFVPIPLKCIGRKYSVNNLDPSGQDLLNAIRNKYTYFQNVKEFESWWIKQSRLTRKEAEREFGEPHMTTAPGVGYYELLEQYPNNILIGYSQGGLVARYLAFLDRHVFKKNLVTAVFTVSSPNYGSPLGNPNNKDGVAEGLVEFFLTMGSFHAQQFPGLYSEIDNKVHFDPIYKAIAAASKDSKTGNPEAADALQTGVKWLSGLEGDLNSAFAEIGIENFDDPHSVLNLVNNPAYGPPGVYTGAVISANPNFDEILRSVVLGGKGKGLKSWLVRCLKEMLLWFIRRVKLLGISIGENEQAAGTLYSTKIMIESTNTKSTDIGEQLQAEYRRDESVRKGIGKVKTIPKLSHDFIIPSVYQQLPVSDGFLGHYVNLHASHNSGKSQAYAAGRENVQALTQLMKELCRKLPS
jgi:hypothetical protein